MTKEQLMELFKVVDDLFQKEQDENCTKGDHGFSVQSSASGGRIYSHCKNCGWSVSEPDFVCK